MMTIEQQRRVGTADGLVSQLRGRLQEAMDDLEQARREVGLPPANPYVDTLRDQFEAARGRWPGLIRVTWSGGIYWVTAGDLSVSAVGVMVSLKDAFASPPAEYPAISQVFLPWFQVHEIAGVASQEVPPLPGVVSPAREG